MLRLHVTNNQEADAAWRMLNEVPCALFRPVEVHVEGLGLLWTIIRTPAGEQTSAPPAVPPARNCQP